MSKRDYYEVLGVAKNASDDDIKKAYRKLAMKHHPDRNQGDGAKKSEEKFKEAKEAYEMLSDPQKRAAYDQYGHAGVDPNMGRGRARKASAASPRPSATSSATSSATAGGGRGARRPAGLPRQRPQLRDGDHARGSGARQGNADPHSDAGRPARPARATAPSPAPARSPAPPATAPGTVQMRQGFFSIQQTCPNCHGTRQDHPRALPDLPRPGPDQEATRRSR